MHQPASFKELQHAAAHAVLNLVAGTHPQPTLDLLMAPATGTRTHLHDVRRVDA